MILTTHTDPAKQPLHQSKTVTAADYPYFKDKLQTRQGMLRSSILKALAQSDSDHDFSSVGQVHDAKDDAFVNLISEVDAALVSHEVAEFRDIELAQQRIQLGDYGRCIDCRQEIEWRRLDANPAAARCVDCQQRRERR